MVSKKGEIGTKNLIPINKRTKEEQKRMTKKAGIASGEARRKIRDIKTVLTTLLSTKPSPEMIKGIQKNFPNIKVNDLNDLMNLSMIREASKGNVGAFNSICDRLEGKPLQKTENKTDMNSKHLLVVSQEAKSAVDDILES